MTRIEELLLLWQEGTISGEQLAELKDTLPEHCYGTEGYVSDHRATPEHWQKIEDLEEEIKKLKAELRR